MAARGISFRFHCYIWTVGVVITILSLYVGALLWFIVPAVSKQTEAEAASSVNRVQLAFSSEIEHLSSLLIAYAISDATREFVYDRNLSYLANTFPYEAYERLGVNIIGIFDSNGKAIYAEQYQLDTKRPVTLFPSFSQQFEKGKPLVAHQSETAAIAGLLQLPETTLLVATRPIVGSNGQGPIVGTIVFARYIDPQLLKRISDATGASVELRSILAADLPPDYLEAKNQFLSPLDVVTKRPNAATIAGYTQLTDIERKVVLLLKATIPTPGEATVTQPLMLLFSITIPVGLLLAFLAAEMSVIKIKKSVTKLTKAVKALTASEMASGSLAHIVIAPDLVGLVESIENLRIYLQEQTKTIPPITVVDNPSQSDNIHQQVKQSLAQALDKICTLEKQLETEHEHTKRTRMVGSIPLEELQLPIVALHDQIHGLLTQYGVLLNDLGLKRMVHDVYDQSKALLDRVEQATDVAKHQLAKMTFSIERFDVIALTRQLKEDLSLACSLKQIELVIDTRGFVQLPITADRQRVRQIIEQLVGNAIKFTDTGSIRIIFAAKDGMVSFSVIDTGKGIEPAIVTKLQTLFASSEVTHDQTVPGQTGVGLTMVKLLLDRMGGGVSVSSEVGHGTTFVVRLPVEREAS